MISQVYSPIARSTKEAGSDRDCRLQLPLSDLRWEDDASPLRLLMRRYALCGDRLTADRALQDADWIGRLSVAGEDPLNYVFLDHAPRDSFGPDSNAAILCGTRVRDFPNTLHAVGLAQEYHSCVHFRQPRLDLIDQRISGWQRKYIRLLVPVINKAGSSVEYLFSAVRRIQPSLRSFP